MPLSHDDFTRLYRRQAKSLLVFFQRRVADPELATDLMADTFAAALEHRAQFRGRTEAELQGWLWAIARSTLREHERRLESVQRGEALRPIERQALTDRDLERIEELGTSAHLRAALEQRLAELPEAWQLVVHLRYVEELSYDEIAERLDMTASGVRTRATRALRQLAAQLQRERDQEHP